MNSSRSSFANRSTVDCTSRSPCGDMYTTRTGPFARRFSASIALSKGSTFMTIPGPPPYGRSSTVLCRSSVWSRGFSIVSSRLPCAIARATTPSSVSTRNMSGKILTTPTHIASFLGSPVHDDTFCRQIHVRHDVTDKRDQDLAARGSHHDHVVSACLHQFRDLSEHSARLVDYIQTNEV